MNKVLIGGVTIAVIVAIALGGSSIMNTLNDSADCEHSAFPPLSDQTFSGMEDVKTEFEERGKLDTYQQILDDSNPKVQDGKFLVEYCVVSE